MHQDLENLNKVIDSFINTDFSTYHFNWIRTTDFVTFDLVDGEPDPQSEEGNNNNEFHTSLEYVQHYFYKLKKYISNITHPDNPSYNQYIKDTAAMLGEWMNNTFNDRFSDTRIHRTSHSFTKQIKLTTRDLYSLRFIIYSFINTFEQLLISNQNEILKFKVLSKSDVIKEIQQTVQQTHRQLCHISMLITLHYRNRLAQQSVKNQPEEWRDLSCKLDSLTEQCLNFRTQCTVYLSALQSLQLPVSYQSELNSCIETYTNLREELNSSYELCNNLKQNFEGDSHFRFENFPLAWSFRQAGQLFHKNAIIWTAILILDIFGLFFSNYLYLTEFPQWLNSLQIESPVADAVRNVYMAPDLLSRLMPCFVLSIPYIWLAWFATRNYNSNIRLNSEYVYRASIAATYTTYVEESDSADPEVKQESLKYLFAPITSPWDNREPSSPYESFLNALKGRTVRKVLKSVFRNGVSSLTEFVNSLTALISASEGIHKKQARSKVRGKVKDPSSATANDAAEGNKNVRTQGGTTDTSASSDTLNQYRDASQDA